MRSTTESRPLKVLLLSLFHPELVRGGAQQVCYELFQGLKEIEGIEPTLLSAVDPSFKALYKAGARITGFDGRPGEFVFLGRDYDYWWHRSGSHLLVESYIEFLETLQPDVVHFHHFLLYGIDFVTLTRKTLPNARIVFTLHEFLTICAADGQMVRRSDKSLCSRPSSIRCHQCFPERGPEEFFTRELWMKRHLSEVDMFTTPTRFMLAHFEQWGLPPEKLVYVTNGQPDYSRGENHVKEREKRNRFGFFGQMVDNKGVWVILQAVALLRAEGFTDFVVELNGENLQYASPERRTEIEKFLEEEKELPSHERIVQLNGGYQVDQLAYRMARVDWCIVASVWWEAFALVISEAWMFKRPVICSNIGAMAERVVHEQNGLNFAVADPRSLADTIKRACTEEGLWDKIVAQITPPPPREDMVNGFLELYRGAAKSAETKEVPAHAH